MSTQLGEVTITSIEHTHEGEFKFDVVRGRMKSLYNGKVGYGDDLAAMILYDALSSLAGRQADERALRAEIEQSEFYTPNEKESEFFITVNLVKDPNLLDGLTTGAWDSYYVG